MIRLAHQCRGISSLGPRLRLGPAAFGASQEAGARRPSRPPRRLLRSEEAPGRRVENGRRRGGSKGADDRGGEDDDEDADMQVERMGAQ